MYLEQAKVEDAFFLKEGCENEDLEESLMAYMGKKDAEIMAAFNQYCVDMQT